MRERNKDMSTRKSLSIQAILTEGWQEWKTVSLVFLAIVLPSSVLLMTPLPKSAVLCSSFIAAILIPPLALHWKERRKHGGLAQLREPFVDEKPREIYDDGFSN